MSSNALPLTPSASASSSSSTSTFKAMSVSYADRIRAGLPPPFTSTPSSSSAPVAPTTSSSKQSNLKEGADRSANGSAGPSSSSSASASREASQSGSGSGGSGGKGRNGPPAPARTAGSGSGAGKEKAKSSGNGNGGASGQVPAPNVGASASNGVEDDGDWQEVVSHPRARNPKERVERDRHGGKREYGSGHREERLAHDGQGQGHGERSHGQAQAHGQGYERPARRDREGLSLSRNTEPGWDAQPVERAAQGQRQESQNPDRSAAAPIGSDVKEDTSIAATPSTAKPSQPATTNTQSSNTSSGDVAPSQASLAAAVPPSPSLGTTLENSSTAASLRSPQPSQSGTEDVHVVGSNGWETPSSTDGETSAQIGKAMQPQSLATKPSIPKVNIWQVRKDRMFTAASTVTGVIAAATAQAVVPSTSALGVFPTIGQKAQGQESRSRSEGPKSSATASRGEAKAGPSSTKGQDRATSQGGRKAEKSIASSSSLPSLSDQKMWPDVQVAANTVSKAQPEATKKARAHIEDGDAANAGGKKEKTKWKAISAAEMQAAIDAVKRVQQSEKQSETLRTKRASQQAQNGESSTGEPSKSKTKTPSGDKQPKSDQAPSTSTKRPKPASVKGTPAIAEKTQFDGQSGTNQGPAQASSSGDSAREALPAVVIDTDKAGANVANVELPGEQAGSAPTRKSSTAGSAHEQTAGRKEPKQRALSQASQDRQQRNAGNQSRGGPPGAARGGATAARSDNAQAPFSANGTNGFAVNGFPTRGRGAARGARGGRGGMRGGANPNGSRPGGESFSGGVAMSNKAASLPAPNGTAMSMAMHAAPVFQPAYGYLPPGAYDYGYYGYPAPPGSYYQPMGYPNSGFDGAYAPAPVAAQPPPPLPVTDIPGLDISRVYILGQLEYYFSMQNLAMDFFLRQQMDSQGWIDIAMIASFNRIKNLTPDVKLVSEVAKLSSILEVKHGKVRLADGNFRQWILPDAAPAAFHDGIAASPSQSEMVLAATVDLTEDARDRIEKDVTRDVLKSNVLPGEASQVTAMDARSNSSSATVVDNKADISVASSGDMEHSNSQPEKADEAKGRARDAEAGEENVISL